MFTFRLLNSSLNSARLTQRNVSLTPTRLQSFFRREKKEDELTVDIIDAEEEDPILRQERIERMRDKSGLRPAHRNVLLGEVPYKVAESWVHNTLKYKRKLYGKLGSASNVDPRTCFWTQSELDEKVDYERVAFPRTVPEMILINEEKKKYQRERIIQREATIETKLVKLSQWRKDIEARKEKKEMDARVAKERKDRLIEEVRRHFGYNVDPRDDRFKEMLEMKEKAQKKAMKESRRAEKESKLMDKIVTGKGKDKDKDKQKEKSPANNEDDDDYDDDDEKKK